MIPVESASSLVSEEEASIDLRQYLALFRQWWWLVVLAALLAGAAAYILSRQMTPMYASSTTVLINEAPANQTADYNTLLTSERLAQTYSQLITKRPVLEKVIEKLGLKMTPMELAGMVTVAAVRDTELLTITVESADPFLAPTIANALVKIFSDQLQETQSSRYAASKENLQKQITDVEAKVAETRKAQESATNPDEIERLEARRNQYEQILANLIVSYEQVRLTESQTYSNVVQVEAALVNPYPVSPKTRQNTLLAAVVGMMLAAGGIFAFDALDDTVKGPDEIQRRLKLPVMGIIAHYEEPEDGLLITQSQPRSPVAESYRALRTNVQYASVDNPLRTLLVTSPAPADGKTSVVANLAAVMSQAGKQVTIVNTDLHRPRVHSAFKIDSRPGLSALFIKPEIYLNGSMQATAFDKLRVVAAGELPPNPSELLGSNKMREILFSVLEKSEIVLVDTPPVLSVTDAVVLAPMVDGVLIVVKPGITHMSALKVAVEQLRYVGANIIGVVINGIESGGGRYGYYYKSYYYKQYKYYGTGGQSAKGKKVKKEKKVASGRGIISLGRKPEAVQNTNGASKADPVRKAEDTQAEE